MDASQRGAIQGVDVESVAERLADPPVGERWAIDAQRDRDRAAVRDVRDAGRAPLDDRDLVRRQVRDEVGAAGEQRQRPGRGVLAGLENDRLDSRFLVPVLVERLEDQVF